MPVEIDIGYVILVGGAGAGAVTYLWTRFNALRAEISGGCGSCRAEYHGRVEQVRIEINAAIVRLHDRLDRLQTEKVGVGEMEAIREDIRRLGDQLALLNANFPKFMAAIRPAE